MSSLRWAAVSACLCVILGGSSAQAQTTESQTTETKTSEPATNESATIEPVTNEPAKKSPSKDGANDSSKPVSQKKSKSDGESSSSKKKIETAPVTADRASLGTPEETLATDENNPSATGGAPAAPSDPTAKSASDSQKKNLRKIEENIVAHTNRQRKRHGLKPLKIDVRLMSSARSHTKWMVRNRSLQHTTRSVAENIAMGQRSSKEAVVSWMNSSGHRANILRASHRRIGVAVYRTSEGTYYWCQQFRP